MKFKIKGSGKNAKSAFIEDLYENVNVSKSVYFVQNFDFLPCNNTMQFILLNDHDTYDILNNFHHLYTNLSFCPKNKMFLGMSRTVKYFIRLYKVICD